MAELFCSDPYSKYRHRVSRVACSGERKAGGIVEDAEYFDGESVEVCVKSLLIVGVPQFESSVELLLEQGFLLVGNLDMGIESEVVSEVFLHILPFVDHTAAENTLAVFAETFLAHPLEVDVRQAGAVLRRLDHRHAAGIVVGGDDDKGLVGMFLIEVESDSESLVEIEYLLDS